MYWVESGCDAVSETGLEWPIGEYAAIASGDWEHFQVVLCRWRLLSDKI